MFKSPASNLDLNKRLDELKAKNFKSIITYNEEFKKITTQLGLLDEKYLVSKYLNGLENELQEKIKIEAPKNLDNAMFLANTLSLNRKPINLNHSNTPHNKSTSSSLNQSIPFSLNQSSTNSTKYNYQNRKIANSKSSFRNVQCQSCQEFGHISEFCTTNRNHNSQIENYSYVSPDMFSNQLQSEAILSSRATILTCKNCQKGIDEPRILPCGFTICSNCYSKIRVKDSLFTCILCKEEHVMPEKGLPISHSLSELISLQPIEETQTKKDINSLKESLAETKTIINFLSSGVNSSNDFIKEHCLNLKSSVHLATEETIQQINDINELYMQRIDEFENECIKLNSKNHNSKESYFRSIRELEFYHDELSRCLKQPFLDDKAITEANDSAARLKKRAEEQKIKLDNFVFSGRVLKFERNTHKVSTSILGIFTKEHTFKHSAILSISQMIELMKLCGFSVNQKWKLLYRATQDGFEASKFHLKCNYKPNTFIIIKSANGSVFGGYTEADWAGNGYKTDANAFIFSFINEENKTLKLKCNKPNYAIYCFIRCGPTFGEKDSDIFICTSSNSINGSHSNLGHSYKHPEYPFKSNEAKSFLAGSFNFLISEIEVYSKE